ncbi:MAG TPA: YARHG domain-containing protein, partial [Bacteroidia bacterium]|nr:YARHG domain-containing protein [Bacteroidia bacterium]
FPYSSDRTLSRSVVQTLSLPELSIARNEIFARHGFPFSSRALQEYFALKPWYVRDESARSPDFNPVEKHNIWLIEKIERLQGGAYKW